MLLKLNFLVALTGTLGSLYFSEVQKLTPCSLCWYQRIFLYPLVIIFGVALWTDPGGYKKYSAPIALIGLSIAIYHNLLYIGVISEGLLPCTQGIPCTTKQLELFGFVTIPFLSMIGFVSILTLILFDSFPQRSANEK